MATLNILRNGALQATIKIDERTELVHKLMGEHKITVETIATSPLAIQIGDYIEHDNERYYLNKTPNLEKINNVTYAYSMVFEGEIYYLYNKIFMDEGQADFSYTGDPDAFLLLLLENINSILPGWTIAAVDADAIQTISFSNDTCRSALTKIAEAFTMEYRLSGKAVYLQKSVGAETVLQFEYGRGNGLYSIQRNSVEEKSIVTRVFGFGARKNIDIDYRDGSTRLVFEDRKLENNIALYGIREAAVEFDDIYPQRTGTVTAIDANDRQQIIDTNLDFDINEQLLEGTVAKIVFKTGALAGYEFEIKRYLNGVQRIEFNSFIEENDYELPNALNFPEVGDEYTLVDINMPQTYIDAAEAALLARTQEYIDENSVPRVAYSIEIDEKYIKANGIALKVADLVTVVDEDLGINNEIRVSELSYPLVNINKVTAVFSDTIPYTLQERLIAETVDNTILTKNVDRQRAELARRSAARFRQLQDLVFDPDGYFEPGSIRPESISTLLLSVGAKSQNFSLMGVALQPNAGGDANAFTITGGQLVHYEIEIDGLGYVWNVDPNNFAGLDPLKPYYVYAKCSRTALTGIWELSEVPRPAEDEPGQYLFNLGILYPVADGRRDFDFTNGMTFISGDTITTGTIQSLDGLNFFDLSGGRFKVGDATSSLDWNVTAAGQLTLRGALLQTSGGDDIDLDNITAPSIVFTGPHDDATAYRNTNLVRDAVFYNGVYYVYTGPDGAFGAFDAADWSSLGTQFESVATNLLLAENANIGGFIFANQKMNSQQEIAGTPVLALDGVNGQISMRGNTVVWNPTGSSSVDAVSTGFIDNDGVRLVRGSGAGQVASQVQIKPDQIQITGARANGGADVHTGKWLGIDADVTIDADEVLSTDYVAAVKGRVSNSGDAKSYGGYFEKLKAIGLEVEGPIQRSIRRVSTSYAITGTDYIIVCSNSGSINVTLPANPPIGREYIIKRAGAGAVFVVGNGIDLWYNNNEGDSEDINTVGWAWKVVYDGVYWQAFLNRG